MTYPIYYYDAALEIHVPAAVAVGQDLSAAERIFVSLKRPDSFIGFDLDNSRSIQMLLLPGGVWLLELLDRTAARTRRTEVNEPMAEAVLKAIYLGDTRLLSWQEEFHFVQWREEDILEDASSPSEVLKTARERSGKLPEEIANLVGVGAPNYYDLESYDDEIETNTSMGTLRDICAVLKIPIQSLFGVSVNQSDLVSPEDLIDRIKNHLQQTKTSIEAFEDRVGFTIQSSLENPSEVRSWNIECLRAVCAEIGVSWIRAL